MQLCVPEVLIVFVIEGRDLGVACNVVCCDCDVVIISSIANEKPPVGLELV